MKNYLMLAGVMAFVVALGYASDSTSNDAAQTKKASVQSGPKLENLLRSQLEGVRDTEVIVSRVTIPPNTTLPKHWHPGEEFGYVMKGSVTLVQSGKKNIVGKAGDVLKIPLKQVHTAVTKDEGASLLVFRVHAKGQPERVLVE